MILVAGWFIRGQWLYPFPDMEAFIAAVEDRYPGKERVFERQPNGIAVLRVKGECGFAYYEADMRRGVLPDEA